MAYILGFFVADGCITVSKERKNNPYTFNITSIDLEHLYLLREAINSDHKISKKQINKNGYQLQIRNQVLCNDLINFGIRPRKTYNLDPVDVPEEYFADFTRGFFDGDGSVYIQKVNGTLQLKSSFVGVSSPFIKDFNKRLCMALAIAEKSIHIQIDRMEKRMVQYNMHFYIDDSEKLAKFMYGNNPTLYLDRKKEVFDQWKSIKRRHYIKKNYPSKIGWHLNEKLAAT